MRLKYKHILILSVILILVLMTTYNYKIVMMKTRLPIRRGLLEFISVKLPRNILYGSMTHVHRTNISQMKNSPLTHDNLAVMDDSSLVRYSKDAIRIVLYRPMHGMLKGYVKNFEQRRCVYTNCQVYNHFNTSDKLQDADAVIFQGNHMPLSALPVRRDRNQVFLFQTVESPVYLHFTDLNDERINRDYFNWTMTYRLDSDIPFPYGAVIPKSTNTSNYERLQQLSDGLFKAFPESQITKHNSGHLNRGGFVGGHKDYNAIYQQKSGDAAWLVSHCKTASKRETYVKEMSKYMKIDIYGKCSSLKCPKNSSSFCQEMVVRNYRFYLAFENSMCLDYITEKAFAWFSKDIVIVVRGGRDYSRHFPKRTFINAEDFSSPKALANYLLKLGSNEVKYTNFLKRKDQFKVISEHTRMNIAYCQLCRMLNNVDKYRKAVHNIAHWWERNATCIKPET